MFTIYQLTKDYNDLPLLKVLSSPGISQNWQRPQALFTFSAQLRASVQLALGNNVNSPFSSVLSA